MTKFSGIAPNASPALADYLVGVTAGNVDDRKTIQKVIDLMNASNVIKPGGMSWTDFSKNIKSALNTSSPTLNGGTSQDLASCGLSLSFTLSGVGYALVTVDLGVSSTTDFENRPEIRLGGVVQQTYAPAAAAGNASNRVYQRSFTYLITLANGVNTISAGVSLSSATSPAMAIGGGSISAIVLGNVTA